MNCIKTNPILTRWHGLCLVLRILFVAFWIYHFAPLFGGSVQARAFIAIAALSSFGLYGLYLAIIYLELIFTRWKTKVHSTLLHKAILHIAENEVTIHLILALYSISFISFKKAFAQVDKMKVYKIFFYNSQEHL